MTLLIKGGLRYAYYEHASVANRILTWKRLFVVVHLMAEIPSKLNVFYDVRY